MVRQLSPPTHCKAYLLTPCDICGNSEHGILLHYTNFSSPCKCCGSKDHGLFIWDTEGSTKTTSGRAVVRCPSVWTTSVRDMINEERMSMKHRPCPQKFAEAHSFNHTEAKEALKLCYTQGSGWHMYPEQFDHLEKKIIGICDEVTRNLPFKRDVSHLQKDDEEDEYIL